MKRKITPKRECGFCWYWLPKLSGSNCIAECNNSGKYKVTLWTDTCKFWLLDKIKVKRMQDGTY